MSAAKGKTASKKARDVERIEAWKKTHRKSAAYRAQENARQRARMEQLREEAAVGRSAQGALNAIVAVLLAHGGLGGAIELAIERALDARGVKPRNSWRSK